MTVHSKDPGPLHTLREMILSGELAPGERVTEAALAKRLGVSRTPIRNALPALAAEGFLEPVGKRGYAIKAFDDRESVSALELRAALEGIAAKGLIDHGPAPEVLAQLEECLAEGDALFASGSLDFDDEEAYGAMNARFHAIIAENCGSPLLASFIERLNKVPFIAPSAIVFNQVGLEYAYTLLFRAHGQHHAIVEAIREKDSARAENLFREHGRAQRQSVFSRMEQIRS